MFNLTNITFDKVKIRELVESQYAGEWGDDSYFPNANVIRATEIKNNGEINYNTSVKRKIDPQQLERKKLQFGDILVEGSGGSPTQPVGRVAYFNKNTDENFICSNFFRVIRLKSNINSKYIFWLLHYIYFQPIIMRFQQQTTGLINFKFQEYLDLEIFVPSNPKDQEYIARVLDNLQNLINLQKNIIRKLVSKKQGLLNDLLTCGVGSHGNLRPSYEDAPDLYQETELGFIPKEWEISLLDDIATRGSGHTPNKSVPSYWNGGIKWVSLADSSKLDQIHISETDKEISSLGIQNSSAVMHSKGTVILSRDAGIGKSAILAEDMAVSQHFMAWKCSRQLNNYFLYYRLQKDKSVFENIAIGSTIKTIGLPFFKTYQIAVPTTISEQEKISAILLNADRHLSNEIEKLEKLEKFKIGLLEDLLKN